MVYCGKPSKSCHACRARKTRCDQKPEGCSQCARVGRHCPGYRRQLDLLFRNKTNDVIQRSQALEAKKDLYRIQLESPICVPGGLNKTDHSVAPAQTELIGSILGYTIQPSIEDCAVCYFVSNYVSALQSPLMGSFTVLNQLYQAPQVELVLTTSIRAIGLASYGYYTGNNSLTQAAKSEYIKAIKEVNSAIQSASEVKKDSTLLSVLLLNQYEIQTGKNETALDSWSKHVLGAATLLELRGQVQLETSGGRLLLAEVLKCLLTCCLQQRTRIPTQIQELVHRLRCYEESASAGLHVLEGMIALNELRVDILELQLKSSIAVDRLSSLDKSLSYFYDHHPLPWQFEKCQSQDSGLDFVFQGHYAVYKKVHLASAWNALRATRIYIHDEIRQLLGSELASLSEDYRKRYQQSVLTSHQMKADILASVPQHLGYIEPVGCCLQQAIETQTTVDEKMNLQSSATHRIRKYPVPDPSHCYLLLWPIWFVGYDEHATDAVRQYCVATLKRIGQETGIQHALVLARIVETHKLSRPWLGRS